VIRVAAIGDVHVGLDDRDTLAPALAGIGADADVLLIAGDLTRHGDPAEAAVLADELRGAVRDVPVLAVLGNHDHHLDQEQAVSRALEQGGVTMLELRTAMLDVGGQRLAVVGAKGFGGGFEGACGSEFGEREMKAFVRHTRETSERLQELLVQARADADQVVVLLHYSPTRETCAGERHEIFPFLGSYLLAEAIDHVGADLVLHGHAHHGTEIGATAGGVPVRNVARPLVGVAYRRYEIGGRRRSTEGQRAPSQLVRPGSSPAGIA
jgi:Icc-related predicted phosphoesterase